MMEILALGGLHGSGKTTLARSLSEHLGVNWVAYSLTLRKLTGQSNHDLFKQSPSTVAAMFLSWLIEKDIKRVVVDGVQNPGEIAYFRKHAKVLWWLVWAPETLRQQRRRFHVSRDRGRLQFMHEMACGQITNCSFATADHIVVYRDLDDVRGAVREAQSQMSWDVPIQSTLIVPALK